MRESTDPQRFGGVAGSSPVPKSFVEARSGVTFSRWMAACSEELDVNGFETRVVCVQTRPIDAIIWSDDKVRLDGRAPRGFWQTHMPGERFRARLRTDCEFVRLVIPERAIAVTLANLDIGTEASRIELDSVRHDPDPFLLAGAEKCRDVSSLKDPLASLHAEHVLTSMLTHSLLRRSSLASARVRPRAAGGLGSWQRRRVADYLADNLTRDVQLGELASLVSLSPFHFRRAFSRTTGMPLHAYMRGLRTERAKEMLLGTHSSLGEIAVAVGYETPQAFARMFRAVTGASPSNYRRERKL